MKQRQQTAEKKKLKRNINKQTHTINNFYIDIKIESHDSQLAAKSNCQELSKQ